MNNTIPYWLAAFWLMLSATTASAQDVPPVLSSPPVAPAPTSLPATASPAGDYLLGRSYRVETVQGTTFTGVLVSMSLTALEFDAKELGRITLQRSQIRRADLQGPAAPGIASAKPGYFDIGNGNRIFFAPTGRGLRKGEGSLQVVDLFLVGANYGLNDYLSVGGYVTLIPGLGASQLLLLTPKVSLPVNERLALGAGVLYLRIPNFDSGYNTYNKSGYNAGVFYGAATYGSADNNFTLGVGYGFFEGEVGKTPFSKLGGRRGFRAACP